MNTSHNAYLCSHLSAFLIDKNVYNNKCLPYRLRPSSTCVSLTTPHSTHQSYPHRHPSPTQSKYQMDQERYVFHGWWRQSLLSTWTWHSHFPGCGQLTAPMSSMGSSGSSLEIDNIQVSPASHLSSNSCLVSCGRRGNGYGQQYIISDPIVELWAAHLPHDPRLSMADQASDITTDERISGSFREVLPEMRDSHMAWSCSVEDER